MPVVFLQRTNKASYRICLFDEKKINSLIYVRNIVSTQIVNNQLLLLAFSAPCGLLIVKVTHLI